MKFDSGIAKKYRQSIEDAFATIAEQGNAFHRKMIATIIESEMQIYVQPVSEVCASGITGLTSSLRTNFRIQMERLSLLEAFGEVYITIAEETIDTGGQRGCEGTFVHEGRHAFDFAQTIASFSYADIKPLSVFNPTLYELEWEAHQTAGAYMLQISRADYVQEGLDLMILGRDETGNYFVSDEGIECRLRESYGLEKDGNQGRLASQMCGLRSR